MRPTQRLKLALAALLMVAQFQVTAVAQVWGEILVGPSTTALATPLAAVAPVSEDPDLGAAAAGSKSTENLVEPRAVHLP
ncbi:MAG: hypothetical protein OEW88_11090 [Gammaproteobacteria bacterium]|nr:hypothetical protein [Gammaproteobacteria bacterium]